MRGTPGRNARYGTFQQEASTGIDRFHDALQRMLPGMGQLANHLDAGGRNITGVHAADAAPLVVHLQHDTGGFVVLFAKDALEYVDHKLHGRVVVVQQNDLIHGWRRHFGGLTFYDGKTLVFHLSSH
jgi:hypothetical protein